MADNAAETSSDAQITFKVKTSSDSTHTISISESATVFELKTRLAGESYENIPVERQRLIYSGRVLKNDDTLATYKIKANNTVHMVKSAASNPSQPAAAANTPTPVAVPTNMASGTANNPLAGLTGARYAGHQINLPGMDMFGPDGGMGPPMNEEQMQRMMEDPNVQQTMNEALNNPDFVNMLIESNPMLRNMPNAREIITSPFMRQMMSNPQMLSSAVRISRNARGAGSAFPALGATDTTPEGAAAGGDNAAADQDNLFRSMFGGPQDAQAGNLMQQMEMLNALGANPFAQPPAPTTGQPATSATANQGEQGAGSQQNTTSPPPANPFAALFAPAPGGAGNAAASPFGSMSPEMIQQMMQMMGGGGGGAAPSPPDNRPPEERYADQLRQLNDMGFFDFDRNVAALRRSGGSVQGAIEHLLSGP